MVNVVQWIEPHSLDKPNAMVDRQNDCGSSTVDVVDKRKQRKPVLLPLTEWEQMLDSLEELDDIHAAPLFCDGLSK